MYLHELKVANLKLIRDMTIPFLHEGKPRPWTVFVGENGLCKTSLLRAIALAATGPERGNQLGAAFIATMPDKRQDDALVTIEATFGFSESLHGQRTYPGLEGLKPARPPRLSSRLTTSARVGVLRGSSHYLDDSGAQLSSPALALIDPLQEARATGLHMWFVAGYGVSRNIPQPLSTSGRVYVAELDRLQSLFDGPPLIATDFVSRFEPETARTFGAELRRAFVEHELLPDVKDLLLMGRGGISDPKTLVAANRFTMKLPSGEELRIPALWMSHGYQSTIAWIADLVGQVWSEAGGPIPLDEIEGLVLIDEIDLHLHPTWQRGLIRSLRHALPRVQFVATTHSPMVLPGLESHEIFILEQEDDGSVRWNQSTQQPRLLTGGEIYERFFDIRSVYPDEHAQKLHRYLRLASDEYRSDDDDGEMVKLRAWLQDEGVPVAYEPVPRRQA
ncbi:AAA family ATPase [Archangium lansingense]|uniref:AAA family ATPase n=1 Tax=Archangium lansingense TaxID=2995310 RepID=A0ABT4A528_9BACT|nr:AAA family ATPase [Archangium lansinium]MCY1076461.1 AAA family ATPase [Archangium lansinium]